VPVTGTENLVALKLTLWARDDWSRVGFDGVKIGIPIKETE
jgi:hypothetical protein